MRQKLNQEERLQKASGHGREGRGKRTAQRECVDFERYLITIDKMALKISLPRVCR
jgi:hypothetical protein